MLSDVTSAAAAAGVELTERFLQCCLSLSPGERPILVRNLFPPVGLLVTCDQLPSPTKETYLRFPPPLMNLWLCTGQDPPGVVMVTRNLVFH